MAAANNGRYCDHCCKTVVDFSVMSNDEVIAQLSNRDKVCGRFAPFQLGAINNELAIARASSFSWRFMAGFLGGLIAFTNSEAKANYIKVDKKSGIMRSMVSDTISKRKVKTRLIDKGNRNISKADTLILSPMSNNAGKLNLANTSDTILKASDLNFMPLSSTVGGLYIRRSFVSRVWHKIKNIF
jgi:hypothetical protein